MACLREPKVLKPRPSHRRRRKHYGEKATFQPQWDSNSYPSETPSASKARQPHAQAPGTTGEEAEGRPDPAGEAAPHPKARFDEKALQWWFLCPVIPSSTRSHGCCSQRLLS